MPKTTTRAVFTPAVTSDFAKESKLSYWKQILPKRSIEYTGKDGARHKINFDDEYLRDLAKMDGVDSVGFLLADKDNGHTMDPERWRGNVTRMEVREDGLYGLITFPSKAAAAAVISNPSLGVSARIREGIQKSDGSTVSRGIIHVLGTLDPQVSGMSPWQAADLSATEDDVLDLSVETYEEGKPMAAKKTATKPEGEKALADYTEAEIDAMSEDELDAFLAEFVPEIEGTLGDEGDLEDLEDENDEPRLVGSGAALSAKDKRDIELANASAATANTRANEALRRMAEAEWRETRDSYLSAGVPPHLLDLAQPVLNRPDEMVIDLSNSGEEDVNVSEVVRGLLDAAKGTVDLSAEAGHQGHYDPKNGDDPDKAVLDLWAAQS